MYILTEDPGPDWYHKYEEYLKNGEYQKIADKIDVFEDKKLQKILEEEEKLFGRARITTASGTYEKTVEVVKGSYENPFDERELEDKFLKLTEPIVGKEKADSFVKAARDLDFDMNIRDMISSLHS
jgi:2-methylcitrate dehydratase PrpD